MRNTLSSTVALLRTFGIASHASTIAPAETAELRSRATPAHTVEPDWSKLSAKDAAQLAVDEDYFGLRCTVTDEDGTPHRVDPECLTFDPKTRTFTIGIEKATAPARPSS